jgi:hypothetical protein
MRWEVSIVEVRMWEILLHGIQYGSIGGSLAHRREEIVRRKTRSREATPQEMVTKIENQTLKSAIIAHSLRTESPAIHE